MQIPVIVYRVRTHTHTHSYMRCVRVQSCVTHTTRCYRVSPLTLQSNTNDREINTTMHNIRICAASTTHSRPAYTDRYIISTSIFGLIWICARARDVHAVHTKVALSTCLQGWVRVFFFIIIKTNYLVFFYLLRMFMGSTFDRKTIFFYHSKRMIKHEKGNMFSSYTIEKYLLSRRTLTVL